MNKVPDSVPHPRPVIQCRCGYRLLSGQDCPECGGSHSDAVEWTKKKRPVHLIILSALVLAGLGMPVIVAAIVGAFTSPEWDVTDGLEVFFVGMCFWSASGALAIWTVIDCALHIGRTRWTPLVWLMLVGKASVVLGFVALLICAECY